MIFIVIIFLVDTKIHYFSPKYKLFPTALKNTRATVDHSADSEFITKLYVVAILKLLAVWESGVY